MSTLANGECTKPLNEQKLVMKNMPTGTNILYVNEFSYKDIGWK